MAREIVLDVETTGLFVDEGHRVISVGAVEMIDGKETGARIYMIVNPGRDSEPGALAAHKLTTEYLKQFGAFADYASVVRDFIGDSPVIITCRVEQRNGNAYLVDRDFLNMELKLAGAEPVKESQWINVRSWSEEMFGNDEARLDKIADRYGVSRAERDAKGHGALLDAELLAAVYPRLKADYESFKSGTGKKSSARPGGKPHVT
ncbi:MAG: DNA polymerase III subunit epsilon [Proteobacteria bacterium]|nr:DNA polymerase III subunit epsilon [Pseudomonadota bacterium]